MSLLSPLAHATAAVGRTLHIPNLGLSYSLNGDTPTADIHPGLAQGAGDSASQVASHFGPTTPLAQNNPAPAGMAAASSIAGAGTGTNANTDPTAVAAGRNNIFGDQNTINGLYNTINGQIGSLATQNTNAENNSYDTSTKNDETQFGQAVDQTNGAYGARGTGDSSYESNDNIASNNNLQTDLQSLLSAHNSNLAKIGQFVTSNQAQLNNKPQYDLSQYTDVPSLTALHSTLGQYIQGLQGMQSGLGNTDSANTAALKGITPLTSNLQGQLQSRLQNLAVSSASPAAKTGLAQGYLNEAGVPANDPTYSTLLKQLGLDTGQGLPAKTTPAAA